MKDKLVCMGDALGNLTVKAYFNVLDGIPTCTTPTKMLWDFVRSKIGYFVWEAGWGRYSPLYNLKNKDFHLARKRSFYGKEEEELEHILI